MLAPGVLGIGRAPAHPQLGWDPQRQTWLALPLGGGDPQRSPSLAWQNLGRPGLSTKTAEALSQVLAHSVTRGSPRILPEAALGSDSEPQVSPPSGAGGTEVPNQGGKSSMPPPRPHTGGLTLPTPPPAHPARQGLSHFRGKVRLTGVPGWGESGWKPR